MKDHTLLNEKYRPKTLKEFVGNEAIKIKLQKYLDQDDIQNFIFYSSSGTGKTTLAKIIINELDCDYLFLNASDERGIETIREKVAGFASTASFKSLKVVVLDEADFLPLASQGLLRNVIETFSRSTRFILTCNFIERIMDPLQSRCQVLKITPPSKSEVAKHLSNILDIENIKSEIKDIAIITNQHYPDIRKMLNTIQLSTNNNILTLDKTVLVSSNYINEIIKELSKKTPNYKNIRQILIDSGGKDFEELYRTLFDKASTYALGREGSVAVILNKHLYQSNFRIDKEINISSALFQIIEISKPQVI